MPLLNGRAPKAKRDPIKCQLCTSMFTPRYLFHVYCSDQCRRDDLSFSQTERHYARLRKLEEYERMLSASDGKPRPTKLLRVLTERDVDAFRRLDCAEYDGCSSIASKANWHPSWTCNHCGAYKPEPFDIMNFAKEDMT